MPKNDAKQGHRIDGVAAAAELLNGLDPEHRKKIMEQLGARDPHMLEKLQERMFTFDDLAGVDDRDLQLLLREVPNSKLVLALRRATPELLAAVYRSISARAGDILREEVETQGPKRVSDILSAQADILRIAKRLEAEGKIKIR